MDKQQLKIGITCYPTFGGSGVVAAEIGMAMAERGHRVHFISNEVPRRLQRFMENVYFHEVEVHDNPLFTYPPYSLALASKMVEVANYENLDLFHVHYAVPHATSAYLAKSVLGEQSPKIITTLHGTDITLVGTERSYLPITRFSIVESDGVTAPSRFLKYATYDKLNVSTDVPIEVIYNFVDTNLYRPPEQKSVEVLNHYLGTKCTADTKVMTHVSNFRPVKRLEDIVNVFAIVRRQSPVRLILIGDGPERSKIERMVREMGLADDVCFLGKQESFVRILQQSHLFLLASQNESFGLAALEALSCGVPVVASNAEGIPEVITHGEVGYLSDVGDTEDMAANALKLLTNDTLYQEVAHSGRKRVEMLFSKNMLTQQYEDYYLKILQEKSGE